MKERNEPELLNELETAGPPLVVFVYTPLCGTCKAARRMLEVAEHLLPSAVAVVAANVNMMPGLVSKYRISSVPALMVVPGSRDVAPVIHYSLGSVERILDYIRSVTS
ncbi:thioredoxin family protein [Paenibacillus albidus]|uniref:thioredoxin domain-containing protein n=1 Tax=Paenibacillus albidus TaxID=2041023 RepID=UPI001BE803E3|nr:thioredoxin family protein [Paenibacillus albidus]MBT2287935.1 thioredoxin family protein [Paenibacillus albidus]